MNSKSDRHSKNCPINCHTVKEHDVAIDPQTGYPTTVAVCVECGRRQWRAESKDWENNESETETYAIMMLGNIPYGLFSDMETAKQFIEDHDRLDSEKASVFWPVSEVRDTIESANKDAEQPKGEQP